MSTELNLRVLAPVMAAFCAAAPVVASAEISRDLTFNQFIESAVNYLDQAQVKANDGVYVVGEWKAQVWSSPIPALVGVGTMLTLSGEEEPSAFTTSSIVNQLAVIYQDRPSLKKIPAMIARAIPSTERYREGAVFDFYPPRMWNGVRVHQAASMSLSPIWKGFTNVPPDADTTSVTYAARHYASSFAGKTMALPSAALKAFTQFRDRSRKSQYWDRDLKLENTGAFMTWLFDENNKKMPHMYFANPEAGPRIPFNINDVDCIVNMNVLRALALTKNSSAPGREQACKMLGDIATRELYPKCGIYYPNTYNFAYSATLMDAAGEKCLSPHYDRMVAYILKNQEFDGSWLNTDNMEKDPIQSTAFALTALARFADASNPDVNLAMRKAAAYLFRQAQETESGDVFWEGQTFFTATAVARSLVDWRSDAFTTAVATSALIKANDVLKHTKK